MSMYHWRVNYFIDFHSLVFICLLPSSTLLNYQVLLFLAAVNYTNSHELNCYLANKHQAVEVLMLVLRQRARF